MNRLNYLAAAAVIMTMSGCKSLASNEPTEALIVEHTEESLQELGEVISKALGAPVTLSRSAFVDNHRLVIERKLKRTIEHGVLDGKQIEKPPAFTLSLDGSKCRVTEEKSQRSWLLTKATCVAKSAAN